MMEEKDFTFLHNFEALCETHHESCRSVLIKLGISMSAIANWRKGSLPNVATLIKIAKYFNVSVGTLVGLTEDGDSDYHLSPVSDDMVKVMNAYRRATEDERQIIQLLLKKYYEED